MADLFLQIGSLWLIFVPYGTTGGRFLSHMAAVVDICLMWLIFVPFGK